MLDGTPTITINTTITATASATICPSAVSIAASSDCQPEKGVAIGAGAALGVVTLVAAVLIWYWRKAERRITILEGPFEQTELYPPRK
jgi:nitrate reductase gamma subunit